MQELKGLGVAMVTPFHDGGKIDYASLERLVKHLYPGADYLVVMGTTGEAATLSHEEQMAVLDFVIEINAGKLPIVFGMGGNNTAALVERMKSFDRDGVVAFLSASPYYVKPNPEGIYRHYMALADASPLPIILYNVPGRTSSNVAPSVVARIAKDAKKKIVGIKEAAGSIEQVMELKRLLSDDFLLISGDDPLIVPHMACGGHGLISVVGNAFPVEYARIIRNMTEGKSEEALKEHLKFLPLIANLFKEGNPGGVKAVLQLLNICGDEVRLPLAPVSKGLKDELYKNIADLS
jgi:4-hydroxy-tetrahydrodipicolinate synthase